MPQSPAGHFCNRNSERRNDRRQRQRGLVSHAAGAVLIDLYPLDPREIQHITAVPHGKRQIHRLARRHSAKTDRHCHGGHLIIRNASLRKTFYHIADLIRGKFPALLLF